jgi:hypothetical protein
MLWVEFISLIHSWPMETYRVNEGYFSCNRYRHNPPETVIIEHPFYASPYTNVANFFYMPKISSCKIHTCRVLITLISHWQSLNCDVDSKMGGLETFNKTNLQLRANDNKKAPKILNLRGFA